VSVAVDLDPAAVRRDDASANLEQRRFAGTHSAKKTHDFSRRRTQSRRAEHATIGERLADRIRDDARLISQ
jgi:hypothetical protein